jgi:flagellar biogenesis protein FliO
MEGLREAGSVLLVFALLGAVLWALRRGRSPRLADKRWWPRTAGRRPSLQSLERLPLSPQHVLHLVEIDGRRLVVATHPQGCTFLTEKALTQPGLTETAVTGTARGAAL